MKLIVVPLTRDALERLDTDSNIEGDLSELLLSNKHFIELWESDIFNKLNESLSIMIDDFEDEQISIKQIPEAKKIVLGTIKENQDVKPLIDLLDQLELAEQKETAVFFYF